MHYGKKNSNPFRLNFVKIPQGVKYYSTKKNCTNIYCRINTELDSLKIYDLLLQYSKKLDNFPASMGKVGTRADQIGIYTLLIDEIVLNLKRSEDPSFKTDPDTFKLILETYILVYLIYIEPKIKIFRKNYVKSNFMIDFEKKVHIAIKNYTINYSNNKEVIKSNNTDKSEEADRSYDASCILKKNKKEEICVGSRNISKLLKDFILEKNLEPIYVYEDLNNASTQKNILTETKGLSGIYLILNKVTLDYYIGSASTNRINKRFANHLIHLTGSKVLKNAVKKYKLSKFAFLILEIYPEVITAENNQKLLNLEDFYLKSLLPNYNILTEAGSTFGYKHSELSRIKMKSNYIQDRRDRIGGLNRNEVFSFKTLELMREKALNP